MSLQEQIDKALERKDDRVRSGKYSPSSLGKCLRAQYWNRKNEPQTNQPDARTLRVFKAGDLFHKFVQDIIIKENPQAESEVLVEIPDFKGYADIVLADEVIDIKSQHSKSFWYRKDLVWKELEKQLYCNILQVLFYALVLEKPKARLVFISKDDLCIQEYPLEFNDYWKDELNKELRNLTTIWQEQVLPLAIPRAYKDKDGKSKECRYCGWLDLCKNNE